MDNVIQSLLAQPLVLWTVLAISAVALMAVPRVLVRKQRVLKPAVRSAQLAASMAQNQAKADTGDASSMEENEWAAQAHLPAAQPAFAGIPGPEVEEADPLEEAEIFISYGHLDEATSILSWHLQNNPGDREAFARLLTVYLDAEAEDAYAETLEAYANYHAAPLAADALANGLLRFPASRRLQRLAKAMGHLGDASPEEPGAGELPPRPAEGSKTGAAESSAGNLLAFPDQRVQYPPARGPDTRTPPDTSLPLVNLMPSVGNLSRIEALALGSFKTTDKFCELQLGVDGCDVEIRNLEWRVVSSPHSLGDYVELLRHYYRKRRAGDYANTLWRLFCVLGQKGHALRQRLLNEGLRLGMHPIFRALLKVQANELTLEQAAQRIGFSLMPGGPPAENIALVLQDDSERSVKEGKGAPASKVLTTVAAYIEQAQLYEAMEVLEAVLYGNPLEESLYPVLMELYLSAEATDRFESFRDRILAGAVQPPLSAILKIIDTGRNMAGQELRMAS